MNPPQTAEVWLEFTNQDPIFDDVSFHYQPTVDGIYGGVHVGGLTGHDPDLEPVIWDEEGLTVGTLAVADANWPDLGDYIFTAPSPSWTGVAKVTISTTDSAGGTDSGLVTIEVSETPPPPIVYPDVSSHDDSGTWLGKTITGNVLSNDSCNVDPPLTASSSATAIYGSFSLQSDGSYTYDVTPGQEWAFVDGDGEVLTYTATNAQGVSDTATLRIKPKILRPGESSGVSHDVSGPPQTSYGHTVTNGPGWENGLGSVYVWFSDDGAMIKPAEGDFYFWLDVSTSDFDHPSSLSWFGAADYLRASVDGEIALPIGIVGDLEVYAVGNISGNVTSSAGSVAITAIGSGNVTSIVEAADDVAITAGGDISRPTITAGDDVFLGSHGDITSVTVKEAGGEVEMSADGAISSVTVALPSTDPDAAPVTTPDKVSMGAVDGVTGIDVHASGDINIISHAAADGTAVSSGGEISVRTLESLQGTYTGGAGVTAVSYADISSLTGASAGGPVSLRAKTTLNATATGATNVSAESIDQLQGSFTSTGGSVSLSTLDAISGVAVSAYKSASVDASKDISGTITATTGSATVVSVSASEIPEPFADPVLVGDVSATISAYRNATVVALGGSVIGTVTATTGTADVDAAVDVTAAVTGGAKADIWAHGNVTAPVSANGQVNVVALGTVVAVTSNAGNADVVAGTELSGDITAAKNASLRVI